MLEVSDINTIALPPCKCAPITHIDTTKQARNAMVGDGVPAWGAAYLVNHGKSNASMGHMQYGKWTGSDCEATKQGNGSVGTGSGTEAAGQI